VCHEGADQPLEGAGDDLDQALEGPFGRAAIAMAAQSMRHG